VYFVLRGESEAEIDKLVYEFCEAFKAKHPDQVVEVHGEVNK
jgi:hypothetical protein